MSYALPGPGTWNISASPIFNLTPAGGNQWAVYALFDNSGTLVPGTYTAAGYFGGSAPLQTTNNEFTVSTTTATSYTIRAWSGNGGAGITFQNNTVYGQASGSYTQIGGLLPYVNAVAQYNTITGIVDGSTTTSNTPGLMPGSTFSITTPGTYQINYTLTTRSNNNYGVFTTLWNVSTNREVPGSSTFAGFEGDTSGTYLNMSATTIITVSAPTTFAVYWASGASGQTSTVYNNYSGSGTVSQGRGDSIVTYT
jgi:hypothetical protein